jgi:hypothetical protein
MEDIVEKTVFNTHTCTVVIPFHFLCDNVSQFVTQITSCILRFK